MKVLAIGAHPDDCEILCGGVLAKYAAAGHGVTIGIATAGDVGSPTVSREEITARRHAEAEAAASVIGADLIWLGLRDEFLFDTEDVRLLFINMMREADADVVFINAEDDYHADHRTAGAIARNCRHQVDVPLIPTDAPPRPIPHMFIMDTIGGSGQVPDAYVDITGVWEIKMEMVRKHESQFEWLSSLFGMDYAEQVTVTSRYRGLQRGVRYAEGFRALKDYPVVGDWGLLPW